MVLSVSTCKVQAPLCLTLSAPWCRAHGPYHLVVAPWHLVPPSVRVLVAMPLGGITPTPLGGANTRWYNTSGVPLIVTLVLELPLALLVAAPLLIVLHQCHWPKGQWWGLAQRSCAVDRGTASLAGAIAASIAIIVATGIVAIIALLPIALLLELMIALLLPVGLALTLLLTVLLILLLVKVIFH